MAGMRRRDFIAAAGATAVAWPLAARAQQPAERTRRIGVLAALAEDDPDNQASLAAFQQELDRLGWSQGRNVRIDFRFARARVDQVEMLAKELVALQPDVSSSASRLRSSPRCNARTAVSRSCSSTCPIRLALASSRA